VLVHDGYLYVATGSAGLLIYRENAESLSYEFVGSVDTPDAALALAAADFHNYIFVADRAGGVRVINVTDPFNPVDQTEYQFDWGEASLAFSIRSILNGQTTNQTKMTIGNVTLDLGLALERC
jgi:hypothetical protein